MIFLMNRTLSPLPTTPTTRVSEEHAVYRESTVFSVYRALCTQQSYLVRTGDEGPRIGRVPLSRAAGFAAMSGAQWSGALVSK